jgi:hypothetical protein
MGNTKGRDYEKDWSEFWQDIVCDPNGEINKEQLKKELSDYSMILEEVPKVYCALTNDTLSKPHYLAETVIAVASDIQNAEYEDRFKDDVEESVINIAHTLMAGDSSDYRSCLYEVLAAITKKNIDELNDDVLQKLKNGF